MPLAEVLDALDYSQSLYYLKTEHKREPEVASLFRTAHNAGVDGIYVFQSSSEKNTTFSVQPAVYVAEAQTPEDARIIHRSLWNLGQAPFLIVVLPNHIRVYTGFDYSQEDERTGIVEPSVALDRNSILEQLADFCAVAINNGQLWRNRSKYLEPDERIDKRLLRNLSKLGQFLREQMGLPSKVAHSLIGKYVYIRYLHDRNILSDQWFKQHAIDIDTVLGRNATVNGLRHLCTILDNRLQGGSKGLLVSEPPHLVMNASWKYVIYSDEYFLVKPRQIGLSVPKKDADYLRALSVFLSSDIVRYYLFFQTPSFGIERDRITLHDVKRIPIPLLTSTQIEEMATVQKYLPQMEIEQGSEYAQAHLDEEVRRILQVPESITTLVTEFMQVRSRLVGGGTKEAVQEVSQRPNQKALQDYAQQLITDLDGFLTSGKTYHRVIVEQSPELICCTVEFVKSDHPFTPIVKAASSQNGHTFTRLSQELKEEFSQWVYVQRGLKMFGPSSVSLYKVPQLINWTRTQAMNDADDMIAEILSIARQYK